MTDNGPRTYTGRCLCGTVTYRVVGPPLVVAQCHCEECRRQSGTGHTVGAMFPVESLELRGDLGTFLYRSAKESDVTKHFCKSCGSPIYGRNTRSPDYVTLALGTLDSAADLAVDVVIFARDKPHWDELGEGVQVFETQPDWSPKN